MFGVLNFVMRDGDARTRGLHDAGNGNGVGGGEGVVVAVYVDVRPIMLTK